MRHEAAIIDLGHHLPNRIKLLLAHRGVSDGKNDVIWPVFSEHLGLSAGYFHPLLTGQQCFGLGPVAGNLFPDGDVA